jgi:putative hydrolase of the HAD superfamily
MVDHPEAERLKRRPASADFAHVEVWLFDLDNTLYPAACNLFDQVDARIGEYVSTFLGLEPDAARARQKEFFRAHGSTLRGMMLLHDMEPLDYLDYVHDIDLAPVAPDPGLDTALDRLPGRKLVFTSATVAHAERVLDRLGVRHHFEDIFDVVAADFAPKPHDQTYARLLERHAVDPKAATFFDDIPRNLKPAAALGMRTVWVPGRHAWGQIDDDGTYIDYMAERLTPWLADLVSGFETAETTRS